MVRSSCTRVCKRGERSRQSRPMAHGHNSHASLSTNDGPHFVALPVCRLLLFGVLKRGCFVSPWSTVLRGPLWSTYSAGVAPILGRLREEQGGPPHMRCRAKLRASLAQLAAPQSSAPERRVCSQKAGTSVAEEACCGRTSRCGLSCFKFITSVISSRFCRAQVCQLRPKTWCALETDLQK